MAPFVTGSLSAAKMLHWCPQALDISFQLFFFPLLLSRALSAILSLLSAAAKKERGEEGDEWLPRTRKKCPDCDHRQSVCVCAWKITTSWSLCIERNIIFPSGSLRFTHLKRSLTEEDAGITPTSSARFWRFDVDIFKRCRSLSQW